MQVGGVWVVFISGEYWVWVDWLWCGNVGVGVVYLCGDYQIVFENQVGFGFKKSWVLQYEVGEFVDFYVVDFVVDVVGDGGVDGVFGDVVLGVEVVGVVIGCKWFVLYFYFVCGLLGVGNYFVYVFYCL